MLLISKLICSAILMVVVCCVPLSHAATELNDYIGPWKQVASNAGRCDRCEIVFVDGDQGLSVAANNGWSATLRPGVSEGRFMLRGDGRWSSTLTSGLRGRPFSIDFILRGDRLHMTMEIRMEGRMRVVKAIFQRHWFGA
ncbi:MULTISPECIES: hypothetical protein [Alphaproteobacteria]|uniref:DUF2147 domain-containing protein n=2 Tax=Alphaproteobacteria TaxID=28211 RepID=A0A512HJ24_9HYPH|nr:MULTISPECIES: hypothetical protein [Alphaproteobacteria]GEO85441.1 hypothetical protein RNA01_23730 [Ciceribacter naphthalenivorans]GLR21537.1 hypothetical protein GCM10007920_13230 [Ciceribacter naphthalenivorans]GLT04393.1 hypothetical protein GCM10007926_13230 [Sphingomonas psychrolutea]